MKLKILILTLTALVIISGCAQLPGPKHPVIELDNKTIISDSLKVEFQIEKNHTSLIEYSADALEWTKIYTNKETELGPSFIFDPQELKEGEYVIRLTDLENNLSDTKNIIISKPPKFDLSYKLILENRTLYMSLFPENLSTEVKSYLWTIGNQSFFSQNVKIPYLGENATISLSVKNNYNVSGKGEMGLNDTILDNLSYCIIKSFEIRDAGEPIYDYKSVIFDFYNIRINVGPQRSKPVLGRLIEADRGAVVLGYGLEVIGQFYGDISRCQSGQLVKGTRTFYDSGEYVEWYDANYPKKPGPKGICPSNSTTFCSDDYSIHAKQKSLVIESDNRTIHWYDIPNIMLPETFFPVKINQTFVSYVRGDNGYCWIKWTLVGDYEKGLVEKAPLTFAMESNKCFDSELPVQQSYLS